MIQTMTTNVTYGDASCNNETVSASNGVYTFAGTATGALTFTVNANGVTYTVTATIDNTGLSGSATPLTATVKANTDSGASQI